jgi:hypothetical protein
MICEGSTLNQSLQCRRGGRKRTIGTRAPMLVPMAPDERWSLDLVSDQLDHVHGEYRGERHDRHFSAASSF